MLLLKLFNLLLFNLLFKQDESVEEVHVDANAELVVDVGVVVTCGCDCTDSGGVGGDVVDNIPIFNNKKIIYDLITIIII